MEADVTNARMVMLLKTLSGFTKRTDWSSRVSASLGGSLRAEHRVLYTHPRISGTVPTGRLIYSGNAQEDMLSKRQKKRRRKRERQKKRRIEEEERLNGRIEEEERELLIRLGMLIPTPPRNDSLAVCTVAGCQGYVRGCSNCTHCENHCECQSNHANIRIM